MSRLLMVTVVFCASLTIRLPFSSISVSPVVTTLSMLLTTPFSTVKSKVVTVL